MIEATASRKRTARGVYALRDLSLRIDKGDFVFLTGPSGAGKSTLLRLLLRQDVPTEGQLTVGGRNLATLTPRQVQAYRRSLGFVFQDFKLLPARPCSKTCRSCRACSAWPRRSSSGARSRCSNGSGCSTG